MNVSVKIYLAEINFNDFEEVVQPQPPHSALSVNISPRGIVTLNAKLREKMQTRAIRFLISKDKKAIILDEKGEPNYVFPKNGSKKDVELSRSLVKQGIILPVRYDVAWSETHQLWVGSFVEPKNVPEMSVQLAKTAKKGG